MCIVHNGAGDHRGQRHQIFLELELQAVVSLLMWVLATELRLSGRTVPLCALNHWAISLAPKRVFLYCYNIRDTQTMGPRPIAVSVAVTPTVPNVPQYKYTARVHTPPQHLNA